MRCVAQSRGTCVQDTHRAWLAPGQPPLSKKDGWTGGHSLGVHEPRDVQTGSRSDSILIFLCPQPQACPGDETAKMTSCPWVNGGSPVLGAGLRAQGGEVGVGGPGAPACTNHHSLQGAVCSPVSSGAPAALTPGGPGLN